MQCFTFGGALLILLTLVAWKANGACRRRLRNVERGRVCRRSCTSNAECTAVNKKCLCDGACGLSCFNPNAECYPLEEIRNGSRNATKSTVGGEALYWCNDGFSLIGSRIRKCCADKRWHPEAPTCELDPCGDPPAIQNGFLNATNTGIGGRVIYNCNAGFGIRGRRRLTCRANRNWHPNVPTCENYSDCGRSWPEELLGRVVGGSNSLKNAWPWQVLIASSSSSMLESLEQNNLRAGGSILNQKWVLSAAHVFQKAKIELIWPRNIIMFAGINKRPASGQTVEESVVAYSIGKYYEHEEFGEKTYVNDIALIEVGYKLDRDLRPIISEAAGFAFGYSIKPVCLPKPLHSEDQSLLRQETEVIVTGFGHTVGRSGGERLYLNPPRTLQQASLRIASNITCREHIEQIKRDLGNNYALEFTESMLCTEPTEKDACDGDSGGPLVHKVEAGNTEETRWVQVGIVSFGYGCGQDHPGYYTKVASFIPWINGKITVKTCLPPTPPRDGFILNSAQRDYGSQITYKCNLGFKLEGSETGTCDDNRSWGTIPNCTLDPDCNFDEYRTPTCGYTNVHSIWTRVRAVKADGLYSYVSEARRSGNKLISAVIPTDWSSERTICLKFLYKLLRAGSSLEISETTNHRHPDISWNSQVNEITDKWHDSLLNIRTDRPIQYEIRANPTVQIDDLMVSKSACVDNCQRRPCRNGGSCTNRLLNRNCFCPIEFKGESCEIDRRCSAPPRERPNARLVGYIQTKQMPGESVTYRCIENYKLDGYNYRRRIETSVTSRCVEGSDGSRWSPDLNEISCVEIVCKSPHLSKNQFLSNPKTQWSVGEEATVRCTEGFDFERMRSVSTVTCGNNERWSDTFTACQDVRCLSPNLHITNGKRKSRLEPFLPGTTLAYQCNTHHKFGGKNDVITRVDVTCRRRWYGGRSYWDPDVSSLRCIDRRCSTPQEKDNADRMVELNGGVLLPGSSVTFRCNENYKLDGATTIKAEATSRCMEGGMDEGSHWSPNLRSITCIERRCKRPHLGENQRLSIQMISWSVGEEATVRCTEGFDFERPSPVIIVTCGSNERWIGTSTACQDVRCSSPKLHITNGKRKSRLEPFLPGTNLTYQCNTHHKFGGKSDVVTRADVTCRRRWYGGRSYWDPDVSSLRCIDFCESIICQNGGTCVPNQSGYTCSCAYGFGGPHCENDTPGMLDLMILIPGNRNHRDTEKSAYKNWLKAFGNYVTTSHAYTLAIYQYGREYDQKGWRDYILERKLLLNGISSFHFRSRIDSLNLNQQYAYPVLYPETITSIGRTPWGRRNSPARKKILIILVETTIREYHTKRISDSVNCMEYEGISVYFIGVTSYYSGDTSTFGTRLKAITGSLNTERNFHMTVIQGLTHERSTQSLTEYIARRRDSCQPPAIAPQVRYYTCRWKSSTENTFHPGEKLFYECQRWSWSSWYERKRHKLCKTDGTWVFVNKNPCERE